MIFSKPVYSFLSFYLQNLYLNPVKTKAISCCVIASAGNLVSQYFAGNKALNQRSLLAYSLFGLFFGGTVPHYFYSYLEKLVADEASFKLLKLMLVERLIYSPIFQAFSLYMIARLEGLSHGESVKQWEKNYWTLLSASWKYLTIVQLINLSLVPPMLRVLVYNLVMFFWTIYVSKVRRDSAKKKSKKQN